MFRLPVACCLLGTDCRSGSVCEPALFPSSGTGRPLTMILPYERCDSAFVNERKWNPPHKDIARISNNCGVKLLHIKISILRITIKMRRKLQKATIIVSLVIALHVYWITHAALHVQISNNVGTPSPRHHRHQICIDPVQRCRIQENQQVNSHSPSNQSERRTLALGDPSLRGGFRNQYMRLTSVVAHAWRYDFQHILLPSIKWLSSGSILLNRIRKGRNETDVTQYSTVPFQYLYDIDHWNSFHVLPKLVNYSPIEHSEWNPTTTLFDNLCEIIEPWYLNPPKTDLSKYIVHKTHPHGIGGGYGTGNLWDQYRKVYDAKGYIPLPNGTHVKTELLERTMASALRPSMYIQAILDQMPNPNDNYLAFHARFEPEMLIHGMCQEWKERDLTKVIRFIQEEPDFQNIDSLFMAIAMPQMKEPYLFNRFRDIHKNNTIMLETLIKQGLSTKINVWMAGEQAVEPHIDPCMLPLVSSFINLELAVHAKYFLGTATSTWSVGVWKLRYFQGLPNYEFTPEGIRKVEGHPTPFKC